MQRLAKANPDLIKIFQPSRRVVFVHLPDLPKWGGNWPWEVDKLFDV
jgi:hypothetical protein